jgi:hypothetical protein
MNKVKQVTRRETPYEGGDILMEWHKEKTSSVVRDADYATPIWRCESEWDRTKEYLGWILMWAVLLGSLYLMATYFQEVVG